MATSTETQTVVEPVIHYCRTCGHAKEAHNLDFWGNPKEPTNFLIGASTCAMT